MFETDLSAFGTMGWGQGDEQKSSKSESKQVTGNLEMTQVGFSPTVGLALFAGYRLDVLV